MLTMKALGIMALWSIAMVAIINFIGFPAHHTEPLWALGGAIMLIITLVGNVWIFIGVAKEEPWEWMKKSDEE